MSGGGGKGGGGGEAHVPYEAKNTLESAQRLKLVDIICEGPVSTAVSLKNILLDGTPIENEDGTHNFKGIDVAVLPGMYDQNKLKGFSDISKVVEVGAEITAETPLTRTITDPLIDSVRVLLALQSLVRVEDNGDRLGSNVSLTVMCGNKSYPVNISGKTTAQYNRDVLITDLPPVPFNIKVIRNTPDSETDKLSNKSYWTGYVESTETNFTYPDTVVVGIKIDSDQFGGKVPTRTYLNDWALLQVPSNYDPKTRSYSGIWDGTFKYDYTDNPAWVMYDLVTNKRYGLGERLGVFGCDKWALYEIAKYCDEIVPDGFGGHEPRFTCNAYLSEQRDAKALLDDVASIFRGIPIWDGTQVTFAMDAKKDPIATFSNANVVNGVFEYQGFGKKTIYTAAHVKYNDKDNGYKTTTEYVTHEAAIARYGLNVKQFTAFGCTSRGQAARAGKWMLETSIRERQTVSFKTGMQGFALMPWDIIRIADNDYAGEQIAARVDDIDDVVVTLDRELPNIVGKVFRYVVEGKNYYRTIESVNGKALTLASVPTHLNITDVVSVDKDNVAARLFRVVGIKENDGEYAITAVLHCPEKEGIVDQGEEFPQAKNGTAHIPSLYGIRVLPSGDKMVVTWEGMNAECYIVRIYRNDKLYLSYSQKEPELKLKGLPTGDYRAEIRAQGANGKLSDPMIKTWSINYDIQALFATPELFSIKLDWTNPVNVLEKATIEIYHSISGDRNTAKKIASLPYPTTTFSINGVKLSETRHFWLRIVDENQNTGNWSYVSSQCSQDTSAILESIHGQITQTELAQELIEELQKADGAEELHTIKVQAVAGGRKAIAGIALGAMVNEQTEESEVLVMADKFGVVKSADDGTVKPMFSVVDGAVGINGDLISNGTILGEHIKANQTISAPKISGGELNINNRFKVSANGDVVINSAGGNVGQLITSEKTIIYDASGNVVMEWGKLD